MNKYDLYFIGFYSILFIFLGVFTFWVADFSINHPLDIRAGLFIINIFTFFFLLGIAIKHYEKWKDAGKLTI